MQTKSIYSPYSYVISSRQFGALSARIWNLKVSNKATWKSIFQFWDIIVNCNNCLNDSSLYCLWMCSRPALFPSLLRAWARLEITAGSYCLLFCMLQSLQKALTRFSLPKTCLPPAAQQPGDHLHIHHSAKAGMGLVGQPCVCGQGSLFYLAALSAVTAPPLEDGIDLFSGFSYPGLHSSPGYNSITHSREVRDRTY